MSKNKLLPLEEITSIVDAVKHTSVIKKDDIKFLLDNKKHFAEILEKTYIWRTDTEKLSILNDVHFPTTHSKFHQSILEQKVQFEQALYLAKDFEQKKLEIEELELDLEQYLSKSDKRSQIKAKKIQLEIQFKQFELKQMQIQMDYRMKEIKGWHKILQSLLEQLHKENYSEEEIWNKDTGQIVNMFLISLHNLQSLPQLTDSAERTNLIAIAVFAYNQLKQAGLLENARQKCNAVQLDSLQWLEKFINSKQG